MDMSKREELRKSKLFEWLSSASTDCFYYSIFNISNSMKITKYCKNVARTFLWILKYFSGCCYRCCRVNGMGSLYNFINPCPSATFSVSKTKPRIFIYIKKPIIFSTIRTLHVFLLISLKKLSKRKIKDQLRIN